MSEQTRKRPGEQTGAASKKNDVGASSGSILADDLARRAEMTGHVVRVVSTLRNGQVRAQHYTNLPAAIRATERAEARGCTALMSLCRVVPVPHVDLETMAGGVR